jgi:hypothetical protein
VRVCAMCSVAEVDEAKREDEGDEEKGCEDYLSVLVGGYE